MPLREIRNFAINRITNKITSAVSDALGGVPGLPQNRGSVQSSSSNRFGRVNPYDGEMVTYPEDLGSEDQGHMILFNINEQTQANLKFSGGRSIRRGPPGSSGEVNNSPNNYYNKLQGQSTLSLKTAPTRRLASSIAMYMPAQVGVNTSAKYGEVEIGSLAVAAQNLLNPGDVPNAFDKPAEFGAAMIAKAKI